MGPVLSDEERSFFHEANPFGLILFARNIAAPETTARLIADFRDAVGRADAPVLIDQEGGRVARLKPPHWPALPSQGAIGRLYEAAPAKARAAATLLGEALAATVTPIGVDVACAPDADVRAPGAHPVIIGDRSFSDDPAIVAELARLTQQALLAAGVATTPKHAPGHGRAALDSHEALPEVSDSIDALSADLAPFKALKDAPFWMTAHIRYLALDADAPATCSPTCLNWLREETGYAGMLLTDDLAMGALAGDIGKRTCAAMAAGCDVALYCPGDMAGNQAAVTAAGESNDRVTDIWSAWTEARTGRIARGNAFQLAAQLWALVEGDVSTE
jgi:beta-N-acetylhexosaminidase